MATQILGSTEQYSTPTKGVSVVKRSARMRFKLKLKKSRQYNVTSRSLFVISVEHLIGEFISVCANISVAFGL